MSDLTGFLLARVDEDEATAADKHDMYACDYERVYRLGSRVCECTQPARVLAECEAKRAIVALLLTSDAFVSQAIGDVQEAAARQGRSVARIACEALATVYADHPDYDEEWRP